MKARVVLWLAFVLSALGAWFVLQGLFRWSTWVAAGLSPWGAISADLVQLAVIAGAGAWSVWAVQKRLPIRWRSEVSRPHSKKKWARLLAVVFLAAYVLTWVLGVPAVMTRLTTDAITDEVRYEGTTTHPMLRPFAVRTPLAIVPIPGIVILYAETNGAGLCDWGGWVFYAWFPGKVFHLGTRLHWIS